MIVTTSQKVNDMLLTKAKNIAVELSVPFVERDGRSIESLYRIWNEERVLVVSSGGIKWHIKGANQPLFFHPGLSVVRIKRLLRGDNDIMIQTCQLMPGNSFLDCTLGLAADSIVASFIVGEKGKVVGLESEPMIAYLVAEGLKEIQLFPELDQAARRISVSSGDHLLQLSQMRDNSFDVVYFDPMFRHGTQQSSSLQSLRQFANWAPLTMAAIDEAKRVAKRRVVLKEKKDSGEFDRLGFSIIVREHMDVAYGVIEK
ncbi:class I SAM-dependent methyltransferase [Ammoniphilus resinae]|uniref:16S rRNA G966 N2-methylase RsmD n=1 Tax=Ammoniphilus resinae TaxID=861532 RepID=A0ABS4GMW7_9BACL|nr:class I SAM-dependent methyltransferase [Ammoniphilus resinae]MBP1931584.1 16S rRNA G966 N2-methylase RsmD [Ammoniphilus resinae]